MAVILQRNGQGDNEDWGARPSRAKDDCGCMNVPNVEVVFAHGARENLTVGDLETAVEGYKKLILHALQE